MMKTYFTPNDSNFKYTKKSRFKRWLNTLVRKKTRTTDIINEVEPLYEKS